MESIQEDQGFPSEDGFRIINTSKGFKPRTLPVEGAELIGQTIGDLVVLRTAPRQDWKSDHAEFRCKNERTGEFVTVRGDNLKRKRGVDAPS